MVDSTDHSIVPQGWTPSPDGRGTMDIVWSCIFTIFLCTWSILCVNIGAPGDGLWRYLRYKILLAGLCILIPDFLQYLAIGQWESACQSVDEFSNSGFARWSMKHAFFADMGGFILTTNDGLSWPLDAKQLHYLIIEGWIKEPMISSQIMLDKNVIDDKNKTDTVLRIITLAQTLWFVINCIGRRCQDLTTTTLEITTLGIIVTSIAVLFFWAHKPAGIKIPCVLNIEASINDIRRKAGFVAPWYQTPLDFPDREESYCFVCWDYHLNILRHLRLLPNRKPQIIDRRRDDNFPSVSALGNVFSAIIGSMSFGINLMAWNFWFPSTIERKMWRASAITLWTCLTLGWIYQWILTTWFPKLKEHACSRFASIRHEIVSETSIRRSRPSGSIKERIITKLKALANRLRNISSNKDPALTVPLKVIIPAVFFAVFYVIARFYLLAEDLIAFRALPADAYKTVNWSQFFLHV